MEPILGFIFCSVLCLISSAIAVKRGNSGTYHFFISAFCVAVLMFVAAQVTRGNSMAAGLGALVGAVGGIFIAVFRPNDIQNAARDGFSKNHKKCQFCAEVVKMEAVRCKHCGADLNTDPE
ncbi:hypothetical protein NLO72_07360 [Pseudomonas tremae]|uniref:zinc ribbon domain-containing protein n=1 Tax=Pseudomonas syringae group TaxID=136849 RepID=UPI0005A4CE53|nr:MULTISPECIES: zinc ribbon domain-containing protein [Pseudomonas syringae group]KGS13887.1 hypothetical protein OA77_14105 [Pseudomonas coronafaciens]MCQ2989056.1 hypothetical protein [Pseudomonas tremae]RMU97840.1 Phage-related membrane protein [Pseudomonas coronafaciens pv. coronafaciens]